MNLKKIKNKIEKIEGFLSLKEGILLYNLARNCQGKGVIVEIGSYKGKSTAWLAMGSKSGKKVKIYTIDSHKSHGIPGEEGKDTFLDFKRNMEYMEVEDIVIPIVKTSKEAAEDFKAPVELIFIDGSHKYEDVKMDFELWYPKVIEGGIMAFHDTVGWPGPEKVVEEFIFKSNNFKYVGFVDSITFAKKSKNIGRLDLIRTHYVYFIKKLYANIRKFKNYFKNYLPPPIKRIIKKFIEPFSNL
jgi:predicted O-methyltransferase YrrM